MSKSVRQPAFYHSSSAYLPARVVALPDRSARLFATKEQSLMRAKLCSLICCLLMGVALTLTAAAQTPTPTAAPTPQTSPADSEQEDEGVTLRGAFLTTRQSAPENSTPPKSNTTKTHTTTTSNGNGRGGARRHEPRTQGTTTTASNRPKNNNTGTNTTASVKHGNGTPSSSNNNAADASYTKATFSPAAIGIGYTLYTRDANGDAVRVDPDHVFHNGEAVRVSLEANTDGYLYIFHTENDGAPEMLFPDSRLKRGDNFIHAHVPYEVPSNMEADERNRWFTFDATPAIEHVYLVVTREPLPDVPTGEKLVQYCSDANHSCPWNPPKNMFTDLTARPAHEQVAMSRIKDAGRPQTTSERDATTRGLGLPSDAPQPTVVSMNASSTTGLLVASITLIHK
jgi:hypothetical protein